MLALLFDYLAVLRGPGGVSEAVWEENRALCAMRFDFSERLQPLQAAQSLAHAMHDYADRWMPPIHVHINEFVMSLAYTERRILDTRFPTADVVGRTRVCITPEGWKKHML